MATSSRRASPAFATGPLTPLKPILAFLEYQKRWIAQYEKVQAALQDLPETDRDLPNCRCVVVDDRTLPFAEVPPPASEKLYLPLDATSEAVVEITIKTRGLGAIDPPTRRAPSAKDLHQVAELLTRRVYQFHTEI